MLEAILHPSVADQPKGPRAGVGPQGGGGRELVSGAEGGVMGAAVEHAVLLAGGIGSRMLPATAMVAKEVLPLVDVPAIVHLLREVREAGCTVAHVVISPGKESLAAALVPDAVWVERLATARPDLGEVALRPVPEGLELRVHVQPEPLGPGDAISHSLDGRSEPLLLIYGDNLLMDAHRAAGDVTGSMASRLLVERYRATGRSVAGLAPVAAERLSAYGVVALDGERITEVVEKPAPGEAPSDLVLCGRYVFGADAAGLLERYDLATHGELQTIALLEHWMREPGGLMGVVLPDVAWYDSGDRMAWLEAQIDHALRRPDLGGSFRAWLATRLDQQP